MRMALSYIIGLRTCQSCELWTLWCFCGEKIFVGCYHSDRISRCVSLIEVSTLYITNIVLIWVSRTLPRSRSVTKSIEIDWWRNNRHGVMRKAGIIIILCLSRHWDMICLHWVIKRVLLLPRWSSLVYQANTNIPTPAETLSFCALGE